MGAFQKSGAFIRITARFVETENGQVLRAVEKTGPSDGLGLFQLQDQVAYALISGTGSREEEQGRTSFIDRIVYDKIVRIIRQNYVYEVSLDTSRAPDVGDLMRQLDKYCERISQELHREMMSSASGNYVGIGLELQMVDGRPTVITALDGTPASMAGLRTGDRITAIDGETVDGLSLIQVVKKVRGEQGTQVSLTCYREKGDLMSTVTIVRAKINVVSVSGETMLDRTTGYIKVTTLSMDTPEELKDALGSLKKKGIKRLVLDLRNNPGGVLSASIGAAELFLPKGSTIIKTKSRVKDMEMTYTSNVREHFKGPLAVLVNKGTSGGGEVLAAALRDSGGAVLVGENTYGKGTISSVYPLDDGSALRLTTAYYMTPGGQAIEKMGLAPDVPAGEDVDIVQKAVQALKSRAK
jgi:carboxyl-terminal processing protease